MIGKSIVLDVALKDCSWTLIASDLITSSKLSLSISKIRCLPNEVLGLLALLARLLKSPNIATQKGLSLSIVPDLIFCFAVRFNSKPPICVFSVVTVMVLLARYCLSSNGL